MKCLLVSWLCSYCRVYRHNLLYNGTSLSQMNVRSTKSPVFYTRMENMGNACGFTYDLGRFRSWHTTLANICINREHFTCYSVKWMGNSLHLLLEHFPCVGKRLRSTKLEHRFSSWFRKARVAASLLTAGMKSQKEAVEHGKTSGLFERDHPRLSFPAIQWSVRCLDQ